MKLETFVYYLIIINVLGFLVYLGNYMLRTHTKGKIYKNEERKLCETPNIRHYN